MRSILRFVFVVVPTAALATGVVVATSRDDRASVTVADGDLQRDLKLASSTSIELAPIGQPLATVSAIEAPPAAAPAPKLKLKRSSVGARALRSQRPTVKAAPEPELAESNEDAQTTEVADLGGAAAEATEVAPSEGGVALPRPTAVPVSFPGGGMGSGGMGGGDVGSGSGVDPDGGWGGRGTVIRGGGIDGDHCQIHGGGILIGRRPSVYGRPRVTLGDRVRAATRGTGSSAGQSRPRTVGERARTATRSSGSSSTSGRRSSGGSVGSRARAALGQ